MARATSNARRRSYDNRLREQQAEGTRERILEAMMELLGREGLGGFSVGKLAAHAGVSEPTIYRHFGSREGLVEAWGKWFETRGGHPGFPTTLEELVDAPPAVFRYFAENAEYIRAAETAEASELIQPGRARRRRAVAKMLAPLTASLEPGEARAVEQVFAMLLSSKAWRTICDDAGVPCDAAGRVIARTLRALVADLRSEGEKGESR
jgi:AcrR family transcriptional regulator